MISIAFFDAHSYEINFFQKYEMENDFKFNFIQTALTMDSAHLAKDCAVVCCFVKDSLSRQVLKILAENGVKMIALRCAGFDNLDICACNEFGIKAARVPKYSPYAIAEYALSLLMALNRKVHKAYNRTKEHNFSLNGLLGFELRGKTIGVLGTGKIGAKFVEIMLGIGGKVLAYDPFKNPELVELEKTENFKYLPFEEILPVADVISIHLPLTEQSHYIINDESISKMKKGVYIINTARGKLIDTNALIKHLKSKHVAGAGLDVYENEAEIFFEDLSSIVLDDDLLNNLLSFHNVILSSHQAFLTHYSMETIAKTTALNINQFSKGKELENGIAERRKDPRYSFESEISISCTNKNLGTFTTKDISSTGLFVQINEHLSQTDIYRINFPMKYGDVEIMFNAEAKVVRIQENGVALVFSKIESPFDEHLKMQVEWLRIQNNEIY